VYTLINWGSLVNFTANGFDDFNKTALAPNAPNAPFVQVRRLPWRHIQMLNATGQMLSLTTDMAKVHQEFLDARVDGKFSNESTTTTTTMPTYTSTTSTFASVPPASSPTGSSGGFTPDEVTQRCQNLCSNLMMPGLNPGINPGMV
jgi:hypothetical protein